MTVCTGGFHIDGMTSEQIQEVQTAVKHMAQEVQDKWYGDHDYHTMYIGEIVATYEN